MGEKPEMLTLQQCSERVGLPVYTLRRWANEGKIIHVLCGKKVLVNYGKLLDFLNGDK
jgi:excisionase family DNA binding protein